MADTRQTEKEVRRQHQRIDRTGVCQVPEDSGEQRKMEVTGCEVICGTPTNLAVKGQVEVRGEMTEMQTLIYMSMISDFD